jgi:hypothetical protein
MLRQERVVRQAHRRAKPVDFGAGHKETMASLSVTSDLKAPWLVGIDIGMPLVSEIAEAPGLGEANATEHAAAP